MSKQEMSRTRQHAEKMHPSLGEHGIAQKMISAAIASPVGQYDPDRVQELVNEWKEERECLRKAFMGEATTSQRAAGQANAKLDGILNRIPPGYVRIPSRLVFRYFVAFHSKCACRNKLERRAFEEYSRRQEFYDCLMGDAVPPSMRRSVDRKKFFDNANPTVLADDRAYWDMLHTQSNVLQGISTNIPALDAKIGGLAGLTLLAGPTAIGKTSFAVELTTQILRHSTDVCVLFLELEVSKAQILHKFLSKESGVPYRVLISPDRWTTEIKAQVEAGGERLRNSIYPRLQVLDRLTDVCPTILSPENLRYLIKQLLKRTDTERCLVVLDSFDRMTPAITAGYGKRDRPEVFETMAECSDRTRMDVLLAAQRQTRLLLQPDGFPFLVISRTRKSLADDRRIALPDVYGSVDLVYDFPLVLLLQKDSRLTAPGVTPVLLDVAKVRDMGETGVIPFDFHFEITKFTSLDKREDAPSVSTKTMPAQPRRAGRK